LLEAVPRTGSFESIQIVISMPPRSMLGVAQTSGYPLTFLALLRRTICSEGGGRHDGLFPPQQELKWLRRTDGLSFVELQPVSRKEYTMLRVSLRRALAIALCLATLSGVTGTSWADAHSTVRPADPNGGLTTTHMGSLAPGDELFWDGEFVEDSLNPGYNPDACGVNPLASCWDYTIDVRPGGERLRVAVADPSDLDVFEIFLYDPSGVEIGHGSTWFTTRCWPPTPHRAPGA
jgi:hypothetical protein